MLEVISNFVTNFSPPTHRHQLTMHNLSSPPTPKVGAPLWTGYGSALVCTCMHPGAVALVLQFRASRGWPRPAQNMSAGEVSSTDLPSKMLVLNYARGVNDHSHQESRNVRPAAWS